jgi:TRAP-type C4-dicarboxylate transport system permease small subunit
MTIIRTLIDRLKIVPAILLLILAGVTFADVVGRNVFAKPMPGSFDIISYMMAILVFSAAPSIARARSHVAVDLLDKYYPDWAARVRDTVIELFVSGLMMLLSWRLAVYGIEAHQFDRVSPDIYLPLWPVAGFCAVLGFVASLTHIANAINITMKRTDK